MEMKRIFRLLMAMAFSVFFLSGCATWTFEPIRSARFVSEEGVLEGNLRRVFYLIDLHLKKLAESSRSHRAGCADLRLTATLRAADRCVRLCKCAD